MKSARLQPLATTADAPPRLPAPEWDAVWTPGELVGGTWERPDGSIDSVQWIDLPGGLPLELEDIEPLYFAWVPTLSAGLVQPRKGEHGRLSLGIEPLHWPRAITLAKARTEPGARVRDIEGGMLAHPGGTIGFLVQPFPAGDRLVVAVRRLRPRLPRWLYFRLQAQLHERSTFAFLRQVARTSV